MTDVVQHRGNPHHGDIPCCRDMIKDGPRLRRMTYLIHVQVGQENDPLAAVSERHSSNARVRKSRE